MTRTFLFAAFSALACGQTFEVAAIRPFKPGGHPPVIGMQIDGSRVRFGVADLEMLIRTAFNIRSFQLEGPDWLINDDVVVPELYDVEATLPAGATPDQVPVMLQNLLKDRFKLAVHKGSKTVEAYVLSTGKDGIKFPRKESGQPEPPPQIGGKVEVVQGPNGETTIVRGGTKTTTAPGRGERVETSSIAGLVDYLAGRLQQPVVDKTGLTGSFDIKLEVLPGGAGALRANLPQDPKELLAYLEAHSDDIQDVIVSDRQTALEKLGLKLEKQKAPVETIVVDHVEKTPTEN